MKKEFFGIKWHQIHDDKENYPALFHGVWCVDYDRNKNSWCLWQEIDCVFESSVFSLTLMVARELILEETASKLTTSWTTNEKQKDLSCN